MLEALDAIEERQHLVRRTTLRHGRIEQAAGFPAVASANRGRAVVQQGFGFTLPLGLRAAGTFDVGASACVTAVEEERAGPDVDRLVVVASKVVIESGEQQLLDLRLAFCSGRRL